MKRKIAVLASIALLISIGCARSGESQSSTRSNLDDPSADVGEESDQSEVPDVYEELAQVSMDMDGADGNLTSLPTPSDAAATCKVVLQKVRQLAMCTIICANLGNAAAPNPGAKVPLGALNKLAVAEAECRKKAAKMNEAVLGNARPQPPPANEINIDWNGFWQSVTGFGAGVAVVWDALTGWTRAF